MSAVSGRVFWWRQGAFRRLGRRGRTMRVKAAEWAWAHPFRRGTCDGQRGSCRRDFAEGFTTPSALDGGGAGGEPMEAPAGLTAVPTGS